MQRKYNEAMKARVWLIVGIAIAFYCYEFFLRIFPSTELDHLMLRFHVGALGISEILASYYFTYAVCQIPAGILLDRYSVGKVLSFAVLICVLGLFLFISTTDPKVAESSRMLIGVGSAFSFIGVIKVVRVYLPASYFSRMVGLAVAFGTLTACYAEVITLKLAAHHSWLSIFHQTMLIGLVLTLILWGVPRHKDSKLLTKSQPVWAATWCAVKQLLKQPQIWLNALIGGLFYAPTAILADLYGTYFLSTQYVLSLPQSAFCISLLFLGWVLGSPLVGYLSDRYQHELSMIRASAALALAAAILIIYVNYLNAVYIDILMFLLGFFSSGQILVWKVFSKIAASETQGTGAAMTNMLIMFTVGGAQLTVGYLMHLFVPDKAQHPYLYLQSGAYHTALSVIPVCLIGSILLSFLRYFQTK